MIAPGATQVLLAAGPADAAHEILLALVQQAGGTAPSRLLHACPTCGSAAHGRPVVPGSGLQLSLARDTGRRVAVVAACATAPVGIDVEARDTVLPDGLADVVLHPADEDDDLLGAWVRKEAALKALGTGLAHDPRTLRLGRVPGLVEAPVVLPRRWQHDGPWACTVAVQAHGRLALEWPLEA